ncbi:unnamed protein product [Spodoptera littoralis]|uniref:Uncharacterized protein n=1 Tax=Spodoptera littoralis TaxID=7109 RepID=A0A9P0I8M7_SPOLI|nr:unnamed protein product [Spodoptera littoralis]CAH1642189.1 unnamed protein product [Spodoptera littoralis]
MEEIFTQLQIRGYNNIENLIKWMAKAHVIDPSKRDTEKWLVDHFRDVPNTKNISLDKFKEIVNIFAEEQNKSLEEMSARLVDSSPGIYVAAPGSEKLAIFSRVTVCSDMSTVTDYSLLMNQDSSNGEVAESVNSRNGEVPVCSQGAVADSSQGEVTAGSQGDVTDCNIQIVTGSQGDTSDSDTSSYDTTSQSNKSDET